MKKLVKLSLLLCFPMVFWTCSKDPETPKASMGLIEDEPTFKIEDKSVSVFFSGYVNYWGAIKGITLKIGTDSALSNVENYITQLDDSYFNPCFFSIWVPYLNPNTEYYYCYTIDYGVSVDYVIETKKIMTPSLPNVNAELPTVVTEEITSVGVRGNVLSDGGAPVTERGICWGKEPSPDIYGDHTPSGEDTGAFVVALSDLEPGVYYVRAYATNSVGTAYGKNLLLVTKNSCQ